MLHRYSIGKEQHTEYALARTERILNWKNRPSINSCIKRRREKAKAGTMGTGGPGTVFIVGCTGILLILEVT